MSESRSEPRAVPLAWLRAQLATGDTSVGIVARGPVDLAPLSAAGIHARAHTLDGDHNRLHEDLAASGRHDVLLDLAQGPGTAARIALLLPHVRRGGRLLVLLPRAEAARGAVLTLLDDVRRLRAGEDGDLVPPARVRDTRPYPERDRHALAASIGQVDLDDNRLTLTMDVATWSVVHESRFDAFLKRSPHLGQVLHTVPAASWEPAVPSTSNRPDEEPVGRVSAPPLSLRSFPDVLVVRGNVARRWGVVLPQAFRNPVRRRPRTPLLADWLPGAVRDPEHPDPEPLAGTYLHADNILRGHFGHAMTEQLSHLWAWERACADHPDLRLLVDVSRQPLAEWELVLLEAAGVPRDRVHGSTGPVQVERLLSTTPGYAIGRYIHPELRSLYRRVGDALAADAGPGPGPGPGPGEGPRPQRLFLTRRGAKRACRNQHEVEAAFVEHGFTVVAPEEHPLPEQVALVRAAEVVAGFGGSGLFHIALDDRPTPVVALASDNYPLANERLLCALHGHPLTVVRGVPDVGAEPGRGFSEAAFHSDFTVDLGDLERALDSVTARH